MTSITSTHPHAIILVGIPGAGKSTFAERFGETFQAPLVSQTKLERQFQLAPKMVQAIQADFIKQLVKTNTTILIDGGFASRVQRLELYKFLTKAGYAPLVVWVQTDPNEARLRATRPYPKGAGLDKDEFETQLKKFQPPTAAEKPTVISGKHTYATQLKVVLKQLSLGADRPAHPPKNDEPQARPRGRQVIVR